MTFDLTNYVEDFQSVHGLSKTFLCARNLMMGYLLVLRPLLPVVADQGVMVLEVVTQRMGNEEELETARVRCWEFIDSRLADGDVLDVESLGARAAICALYKESPDENVAYLLEFFMGLVCQIKLHEGSLEERVSYYFK
ncbi:hypothetical protein QWZ03_14200 [Chitinimonas viridis]|uniref:Uncharacterized protein n=1 Tax=Chitinimonas viridis TaxID=664880 RepID=A0ABT8B7D1_9NEIS|nr:hypothetical protein [Chitinimonas viridis]MDN3577920.1 hypothetical protein [Chitinimonas viridis]